LVVKIVYAGFPVKEDGKSPSKACTLFGYYYKAIVFIPFFHKSISLTPSATAAAAAAATAEAASAAKASAPASAAEATATEAAPAETTKAATAAPIVAVMVAFVIIPVVVVIDSVPVMPRATAHKEEGP
jgi:hypothetical protein